MLQKILLPLAIVAAGTWLTPANAQVPCPILTDVDQNVQSSTSNLSIHRQQWISGEDAICPRITVVFNAPVTLAPIVVKIYDGETTGDPVIYNQSHSVVSGAALYDFDLSAFAPTLDSGNSYLFELSRAAGNFVLQKSALSSYGNGDCITCVSPPTDDLRFKIWYQNDNPAFPDGYADTICSGDVANLWADESTYDYYWYSSNDTTLLDSTSGGGFFSQTLDTNTTYLVGAYDSDRCVSALIPVTAVVNEVNLSYTKTDLQCHHDGSGSINLTPVSDNGLTMTYDWSIYFGTDEFYDVVQDSLDPQDTNQDLVGLYKAAYNVTVEDSWGCTAYLDSIPVDHPDSLALDDYDYEDVTCYGLADGEFSISILSASDPGTPNYTYDLTPGGSQTTSNDTAYFTSLGPNTYGINITDSRGCTIDTVWVIIDEPDPLDLTEDYTDDVECYGDDNGEIGFIITGGTTTYETILYSSSNDTVGMDYSTSDDFNGLGPDTYYMITRDANGCNDTVTGIVVVEPDSMEITDVFIIPNTCFGDDNAEIYYTATGGVVGGSGYCARINFGGCSNVSSFEDLYGGYYDLRVWDDNSCIVDSVNIHVEDPPQLVLTATVDDVACFGDTDGNILVEGTGGMGDYTFTLDFADSLFIPNPGDSGWYNLPIATYYVVLQDTSGCEADSLVDLNGPALFQVASITRTHVTCYGAATGTITTNMTGGTPPYSYSYAGGSYGLANGKTNLTAGTYSIEMIDDNGCVADTFATLTEPATPVSIASRSYTHNTCYDEDDGTLEVRGTGGTPFGGATKYTINLTGPGSWNYDGASGDTAWFDNMEAEVFAVRVFDANGCLATDTIEITEPDPVEWDDTNPSISHVTCVGDDNGSIHMTGRTGGTAPYNFVLVDYFDYSDTIQYNATGVFNGLSGGRYAMWVTDANGCESIDGDVTIGESTVPLDAVVAIVDTATCGNQDGSVTLNIFGGTPFAAPPAYIINWNGVNPAAMASGSHSVTVTDLYGCDATTDYVMVDIDGVDVVATTTNVSCYGGNDGTATLAISGGTLPYNEDWLGLNPNALGAGTFRYIVTDGGSCVTSQTVTITQPPAISTTVNITNETSCGSGNGILDITVYGGTPGFTYLWDDANAQTTQDATGLKSGTYTVTITDNNGCKFYNSYDVKCPSGVGIEEVATISPDAVNVYPNPNDGLFTIEISSASILDIVSIELHNAVGQVIFTQTLEDVVAFKKQVNISEYSAGVYYVKVIAEGTQTVKKVIVH